MFNIIISLHLYRHLRKNSQFSRYHIERKKRAQNSKKITFRLGTNRNSSRRGFHNGAAGARDINICLGIREHEGAEASASRREEWRVPRGGLEK